MGATPPTVCFVLVVPSPRRWFDVLSTAFTHPWVASYQIGFGPPLVRAHDRLIAAAGRAKSALEKLEAYLNHCYHDDDQRRRLAALHRRLLVRRHGPVEAEAVRAASRDVLDLSVQLYPPLAAPDGVRGAMRSLAGDEVGEDAPPEHRTARFWIHLADPLNARLLAVDAVQAEVAGVAPAVGPGATDDDRAAMALTVPVVGADLFAGWLADWAPPARWPVVRLEGPVSVARAYRDGVGV